MPIQALLRISALTLALVFASLANGYASPTSAPATPTATTRAPVRPPFTRRTPTSMAVARTRTLFVAVSSTTRTFPPATTTGRATAEACSSISRPARLAAGRPSPQVKRRGFSSRRRVARRPWTGSSRRRRSSRSGHRRLQGPHGIGTYDSVGHGTHVAGIAGGRRFGVAKQSTLHASQSPSCRAS